jgi:hypothetical protein
MLLYVQYVYKSIQLDWKKKKRKNDIEKYELYLTLIDRLFVPDHGIRESAILNSFDVKTSN